jgi:hypothetical protein
MSVKSTYVLLCALMAPACASEPRTIADASPDRFVVDASTDRVSTDLATDTERADTVSDTSFTDATPAETSVDASVDVISVNGCLSHRTPIAMMGDPPGGETYTNFARGFFETWCVRCHSSRLNTPIERNGAPEGFNWDDETAVRREIVRIRAAVGVDNWMPLTPPNPSCDERQRLVRWIDLGAP